RGIAKARDGPIQSQAVRGELQADGIRLAALAMTLNRAMGSQCAAKGGACLDRPAARPFCVIQARRRSSTWRLTTISRFNNEQAKYDLLLFNDN
ncbi:hypothetical protein, partial [Pseudomonas syringae]|uniref:hypothetical protein n=1 Tax=Pseudomonas syringae TaxID=317 RepID=UPI001955291E